MEIAEPIILTRLIKRDQARELLEAYASLMPGIYLALVHPNGQVYVQSRAPGTALPAPEEIQAGLRQPDPDGQSDYSLLLLSLNNQEIGGLLALPAPAPEVISALLANLNLFLTQAQETRQMARETLARYRELNLLYHLGETIGASLDPDEIFRLVLAEAETVIPSFASAVLLPEPSQPGNLAVHLCQGPDGASGELASAASELVETVFEAGRADIRSFEAAEPGKTAHALCAPLKVQDRILGVVLLGRERRQLAFTASDEKMLLALASQAAIAAEKAWLHQQELVRQRMEEELEIGRRIQLSLLPRTAPTREGWEFAVYYQPAREVGGDFYDFFELPEISSGQTTSASPSLTRLGIVIADVTGKGVPAALMMAFSRAMLRTASTGGLGPAAVLATANELICLDSQSQLFLTAFYAILDPQAGTLVFANGGHEPPIWWQAVTGRCQELTSRSMLLGAFPNIQLEEVRIELAPGDFVVFFTDGLTEARRLQDDTMFGQEGLVSAVSGLQAHSAAEVLQATIDAIKDFSGDAPPADDLTLLVIKRLPEDG
jgi:serine phosphatase RsbU (regulator of sigma subunit)